MAPMSVMQLNEDLWRMRMDIIVLGCHLEAIIGELPEMEREKIMLKAQGKTLDLIKDLSTMREPESIPAKSYLELLPFVGSHFKFHGMP